MNTGLFFARPSLSLFRDGLAVLRGCEFSAKLGWQRAGSPRSLIAGGLHPRRVDGSPLDGDSGNLSHTEAFRRDTWLFAGGEVDQGYFWYMAFIRHDAGAYLDPDAASFAPPPGAPPPPPLTPPRPSPKISRKSVEDESATAAAIDAALRGLSPPAPRGKHRGSVDDEAAAIDAALRGLTPPATPLSSRSPLRKRVEPRAPSLSVDSARSALSAASSSGSSRRSAALSPLSDEALEALSPPKTAEEPDTARTDESGSKVDWEESEHVVDWVLGAA